MRAVVTGGAGYIGSMVVGRLLAAGHEVRVLDLLLHGQRRRRRRPRAARGADIRGRRPRRSCPRGRARGRRRASSTSRRSSATPPARSDPELSRAVNVEASRALFADGRGWRRANRVRLDLLELRPHGRPDRADRRERAARARLALREQKVEIERAARSSGARCDLPALRHRLRRRPAHALRPHRQRVHARPVGGPRARGLRRASSGAPTSTSATRRARCELVLSAPGRESGRPRVQRRRLGRELPQARPRRDDHRHARARRGALRRAQRGPARLQACASSEIARPSSASSRRSASPTASPR